MLYNFSIKRLSLIVTFAFTAKKQQPTTFKCASKTESCQEDEAGDQEDEVPKEWLELVNVVMTPDIPAIKGVMLSTNRAIQINSVGIDDTGIFYTSKGERWFDFLMNVAKIAKWQVRICKGGFIIKPDTAENSYWQSYAIPLPPGKRTSWTQTGDNNGTTKAEFNKDIWAEIISMFSNWERGGSIKSFIPMSQSSIICVDATQAMHREITRIVESMITNMNTKIALELQIVELDLKPGASVPNIFMRNLQEAEQEDDPEAGPASHFIPDHNDKDDFAGAMANRASYLRCILSRSLKWMMGEQAEVPKSLDIITDIASGITFLQHYGKVKTVFKWNGHFNHNDAFTAGSIETKTAFIQDSKTEVLSDKKLHPITSSTSKQILPVGVTMHVVGTANEEDNITLSMQFEMTEAGKNIDLPNRKCVVAGDVPESVKHNFTTVVSMRDGETRIIGGLKIIKSRHGSFGLKKGELFWRSKSAEERELQILVKASIIRHKPVRTNRSLDYYELHTLEDLAKSVLHK